MTSFLAWFTCGVEASPTAWSFIFIRATLAARLLDLAPPRPAGENIQVLRVISTHGEVIVTAVHIGPNPNVACEQAFFLRNFKSTSYPGP